MSTPTYHDLYIETPYQNRISIFNLPYNHHIECRRTCGWILCVDNRIVAGEYHDVPLRLDVAGTIICDSMITAEYAHTADDVPNGEDE